MAVKDHTIREFVNELTRIAKQMHNHQQLREVISHRVKDFVSKMERLDGI